jgi:hypothetical protein
MTEIDHGEEKEADLIHAKVLRMTKIYHLYLPEKIEREDSINSR